MSIRNQQAQTQPTIQPVLNMGHGFVEQTFKEMTTEDLKSLLELLDDDRIRDHFNRLAFKLRSMYVSLGGFEGNNADTLEFNRIQTFTMLSFLDAWGTAAKMHRDGTYALTQPLPESSEQF